MMASEEDDQIFKNLERHWESQTEKNSTPNFRALFGCPVCKEVANPPIFVCLGGHLICAECRKKHKDCPKCKSVVSTTHSEFAEKFMSTKDLNCKYEDDGCNLTVKATDFRNHVIKCPNRPIKCFLTKCAEEVPFKKFFRHLTSIHSDKVNGIENNSKHTIEWWIDGDPSKTARWPPFYLTCFGNVFLYMAISTKHGSWEWAWVIANEDEAKRFRIKTSMDNKTKNIGVQWTGAVHSIRTSIHDILATGLVFVTSTKELQNPFLFGKSEEKSKHFWRSDVEIQEIVPPPSGFVPYLSTEDDSVSNLVSARSHEFLLHKENLSTQSTFDIRIANHAHEKHDPVIKVPKDVVQEKNLSKSTSSTDLLPGDNEDVGSVHGLLPAFQDILQELPPPPAPTKKIKNKSGKTEKTVKGKSLENKTVEETQPKKKSLKDDVVEETQPQKKSLKDEVVEETQPKKKSLKDEVVEETQPKKKSLKDEVVEETQPKKKSLKDEVVEETQPKKSLKDEVVEETQPKKSLKDEVVEETQPQKKSLKDEVVEETQPQKKSLKDEVVEETQPQKKSLKDEVVEETQPKKKFLKDEVVEETQPKKKSLKDEVVEEPQSNSEANQSKGERQNLKVVKYDKNSTEVIYTNSAAQTMSIEALEAEQKALESSVEENSLPTNKTHKAVGSDSALPYYDDDGE